MLIFPLQWFIYFTQLPIIKIFPIISIPIHLFNGGSIQTRHRLPSSLRHRLPKHRHRIPLRCSPSNCPTESRDILPRCRKPLLLRSIRDPTTRHLRPPFLRHLNRLYPHHRDYHLHHVAHPPPTNPSVPSRNTNPF